MPAFIGRRVGVLPAILADISDLLGEAVKRGLPDSDTIHQLGGSLREVRGIWEVAEHAMVNIAMADIVPGSWLG